MEAIRSSIKPERIIPEILATPDPRKVIQSTQRAGTSRSRDTVSRSGSPEGWIPAGIPAESTVWNMRATIQIEGPYAFLHEAHASVLAECLRFPDPKAKHTRAFREGRVDGMVSVYDGLRFPAGLIHVVRKHLREKHCLESDVVGRVEEPEIDLSRLTDTYVPGFTLRDHQLNSIRAMLLAQNGYISSPTGSGKTLVALVVARYLYEAYGYRTLMLTPKAVQTFRVAKQIYGSDLAVGLCADGTRTIGHVTIGTPNTVAAFRPSQRKGVYVPHDPELEKLVHRLAKVLILDECHHASAQTWYEIAMASCAIRRYGMSGTPTKGQELADARMTGATGSLLYRVPTSRLMDLGFVARKKIAMVMSDAASGPLLPFEWQQRWDPHSMSTKPVRRFCDYDTAYRLGVVEGKHHNAAVILAVRWLIDHGRKTLVLCRKKSHFALLAQMLDECGCAFRGVNGDSPTEERDRCKSDFASGRVRVLLSSEVLGEGEDMKGVEAIVLAEGVSSGVNALQRVGRGREEEVWVVDIVPTCHPTLTKHAAKRASAYEKEGYEVRMVEEWPEKEDAAGYDTLLPFLTWDKGRPARKARAIGRRPAPAASGPSLFRAPSNLVTA